MIQTLQGVIHERLHPSAKDKIFTTFCLVVL